MILQVARIIDADNTNCNNPSEESNTANIVPVLSVQQEREIAKCFQLVVAFGLLPNLLPNVGVPVQKRSKWPHLFLYSGNVTDEQVIQAKIIMEHPIQFSQFPFRNIQG